MKENLPLRTTSHAEKEPLGASGSDIYPKNWSVYISRMCKNVPGLLRPQQVLRESGEGGQTAEEVERSDTATLIVPRACQ